MWWLVTLEMEKDLIAACRVMNVIRRKGLQVATLALVTRPWGFSLIAVVECPEDLVDHIFNFLRGMGGVHHVTYYRHGAADDVSLVFVDGDAESSRVAELLEAFPGSQLILASQGKYLLEIPAESWRQPGSKRLDAFGLLPFTCVKSTRKIRHPELVPAQ
jgi:hypothetical protein